MEHEKLYIFAGIAGTVGLLYYSRKSANSNDSSAPATSVSPSPALMYMPGSASTYSDSGGSITTSSNTPSTNAPSTPSLSDIVKNAISSAQTTSTQQYQSQTNAVDSSLIANIAKTLGPGTSVGITHSGSDSQIVVGSPAQQADPLVGIYQSVLGRAPDQAGETYWSQMINSGKMTISQVQTAIAGSSEAQQKAIANQIKPSV